MKQLFLLRHAEAVSSANKDKERNLSERGHRQAKALGEHLKNEDLKPEAALCSPANRTRQTLENLMEASRFEIPFSAPEKLYHASPGDLLSFIQKTKPDIESLLLVNHNPSIHQLAFMLSGSGDETLIQKIAVSYKPCTLTILKLNIANWKLISPGEGELIQLIEPLA